MDNDPLSSTASTPDDAAFRTLALRLLAMYHPQFGGAVPDDNVKLIAGQIASEFPSEVPLPDGSRVQGSFLTTTQVIVVLDCDLPLERLYDFYSERLPAVGWSRTEHRPGLAAGFARPWVAPPGDRRTSLGHIVGPFGNFGSWHMEYRQGDGGPSLHITATMRETDRGDTGHMERGEGKEQDAGGLADVRLTLVPVDPTHPAFGRMREQPMPAHLPVLSPPPGAGQQEGGASYSPGRHFSSTATLFAMGYDVAAVGRHYDEQLARAGWTASSVGTSPPVTWSTWTLTDHEGEPWWAILFAVQLPTTPERYALTFRAEAVRPDAHAGQSGGSGFISVGSSRMISSDYHPPTPS